jgi:hypothetical protein
MNTKTAVILKDIVSSLAMQNGIDWCGKMIDRITEVENESDKEDQLAIKFGHHMRQNGSHYMGNFYMSTKEVFDKFKRGEIK